MSKLLMLSKLTASLSKRWGFTQRAVGEVSIRVPGCPPPRSLTSISHLLHPLTPLSVTVGYGNSRDQVLGKGVDQAYGKIFLPQSDQQQG